MTREQLEQEVFKMAQEDLNATDEEIWDSIAVTSDDELKSVYRKQKRIRALMED